MAQDLILDTRLSDTKNLAWWLYIGHAASFFFSLGLFSFIPLIINYVKRPDTVGTFVHTHHTWQIRSFWWYVCWIVVGTICYLTFILIPLALLVWAGAWLWKAYRLIKGLLDLNENKAMPV
jgi:uncharacterized membrane protein